MGDPSHQALAPRFNRLLAWLTDLCVAIGIGQVVIGAIGYFLPPEVAARLTAELLVGFGLGIAYFGFATPLLGNTLGKWLFDLRVASHTDQPVPFSRWLIRVLLIGLWPINGVLVLVSQTRRHLGDLAANTVVSATAPKRNLWISVAGAILIAFVTIKAGGLALRIAVLNSEAWTTVKKDLAESAPGAEVPTLPSGFLIEDDQALFDAQLGDRYRRVALRRIDGRWTVQSSKSVGESDLGASIAFGQQHFTTSADSP